MKKDFFLKLPASTRKLTYAYMWYCVYKSNIYICALHVDRITGRPARMQRMGSWTALPCVSLFPGTPTKKLWRSRQTHPSIGVLWIRRLVYKYSGCHMITPQELRCSELKPSCLFVEEFYMGIYIENYRKIIDEWGISKCCGKPNGKPQVGGGLYNVYTLYHRFLVGDGSIVRFTK